MKQGHDRRPGPVQDGLHVGGLPSLYVGTYAAVRGPRLPAAPFRSRRIGGRYVSAAIDHSPRPCVAAMIVPPSEVSDRSFVEAFGSPVPNRDHEVAAPPPAAAMNTPMSVARTSRPFTTRRSSLGASGRFPEMSVHVPPPSVVST